MAYCFGDGFDCYATVNDPIAGYWDSGTTNGYLLTTGRFAGSQCLSVNNPGAWLVKSSGVNDAVHHIVCAVRQTVVLSGSTLGLYLQLSDAATNQVCVVFRSDGVVLLTSATPTGTVLATYTGAISAQNAWTAFEFEVVISATVGRFRARKNGNTSDDFDSGATLNTRPGTNAYANKLTLGVNTYSGANTQQIDDLLWRSDASSVPFVGDVRCYTRMPASDASVQFTRSTGASNFSCVDEAQQNATTDYVFDSVVGHADFYGLAPLAVTPASVIAVITRGFVCKSDAGARTGAVQLKSGGTTVASSAPALSTTFGWLWRSDVVDPATSSPWTPAGVNSASIGPVVIS